MAISSVVAGEIVDPAWGNAVAEQLNELPLKIEYGRTTVTTDAGGVATITFTSPFGSSPVIPMPAVPGTSVYITFVSSTDPTEFDVTVEAATTGAPYVGSITIGWLAIGIPVP